MQSSSSRQADVRQTSGQRQADVRPTSGRLQANNLFAVRKSYPYKVETILKGSLDSIISPLPSVKIQILGGKICLRETLPGVVNKLLKI